MLQMNAEVFTKKSFNINDENTFNIAALEIFHFQYRQNLLYRQYIDLLKVNTEEIKHYSQVPFLPIEFFKTHPVVCQKKIPEEYFISSGTGGMLSRHYIADYLPYQESFTRCFRLFYGNPEQMCILALLPSYLERSHSSLIYMVNHLMKLSGHPDNGFYLYNHEELAEKLSVMQKKQQATLLIGVTFALLDFAEHFRVNFPSLTIMETGGMKGRKAEPVREEVHKALQNAFGTSRIHSEYGMTELFSQAYSLGNGLFRCPPWMKVLIRDTHDPLTILSGEASGGINIIDLANYNSCAFIATQDIGKSHPDGSFEVLGRFDQSEIRGCSLMIT